MSTDPEISAAVHANAILYCNHTSFPPAYPVKWLKSNDVEFPITTPITENSHYLIDQNKLVIKNVTIKEDHDTWYKCEVSNPCEFTVSEFIRLKVVELPASIDDLRIEKGPSLDSVSLKWTLPIEGSFSPIDGYRVRVKESNGKYQHYADLDYYGITKTSLTGLTPGTNYSVIVSTHNLAGESASNELMFMTNVSGKLINAYVSNLSVRVLKVISLQSAKLIN